MLSVLGLGVAGDSLSDEYFDQVPPAAYAKNWVELMPARGVNVGEYRVLPDTWPDVREQGYQFNWAVAGATSGSLLADSQHTGLAQQVDDGLVDHAVVAIGQNDYWPLDAAYQGIYAGTWTDAQIDAHNETILANITTAVDTLMASGVKLVISDVIDYGVTPFARGIAPDPVGRQRVADAVGELNFDIAELAFDNEIPWVKSGVMVRDSLGEHGAEVPFLPIGGVEITNTAGVDPHNAFVLDGIHPHTVLQGILGNAFVTALNLGYDADIPLFSEEEMLIQAGITGEYVEDTLDLVPEDYVVLPDDYDWGDAPEPYPTLRSAGGAVHRVKFPENFWLGTLIDEESDGQPTPGADGDDANGDDDEDGVVFEGPLVPGETVNLTVNVMGLAVGAWLNAWFDVGQNGDWLGPNERVISEGLGDGAHALEFVLPEDAAVGQTYARFRLGGTSDLGPGGFSPVGEVEDYRVTIVSEDLGQITSNEMSGLEPLAGDLWYRMTTSQAGYLTCQATYDTLGGTAELILYDSAGDPIDASATGSGTERVECEAGGPGEVYFLEVTGTNDDVDLRLSNLVHHDDTTVTVTGTDGPDDFAFDASAPYQVTVNGVVYEFAVPALTLILFDGRYDGDSFFYDGTLDVERAEMYPFHSRIKGASTVVTRNIENATVNSGGGDDVAQLYDSPADDSFYGSPTQGRFYCPGEYSNTVNLYPYVHGYGSDGDTAILDGSATGQDWYVGTPQDGRLSGLRDDGASFFNRAKGFDAVTVNSFGGSDVAQLYDSPSDDEFIGTPTYSRLSGPGYEHEVKLFDYVHTYGSDDGEDDTAILDGSATGQDWFVGTPQDARLFGQRDDGTNFFLRARSFDEVSADSRGGNDVAQLYDSPGEDELTADPETATLFGPGYHLEVKHFQWVHTYASDDGEEDTAELNGSATGQDRFIGTPEDAKLTGQRDDGTKFFLRAKSFDEVSADSRGGSDVAELHDSPGEDELTADPETATLFGPGYYLEARHFQWVHTYGSDDGEEDTAELSGSATGQDWFVGTPEDSQLIGQRDDGTNFFLRARRFDKVSADSRGGSDVAELHDSPGEDELTADPETATLSGLGYELTVNLFSYVHTYASDDGHDDTAIIDGSVNGQDWWVGTPEEGELFGHRVGGTKFFLRARSFDAVTVNSGGGSDVAQLYDSPGEDELTADPETATLSGPGFELTVNLFDYVHTYASDDGQDDMAFLNTDPLPTCQDYFYGTHQDGRLSGQRDDGTDFFLRAVRFDQLVATSHGGDDVAQFFDSPGDDVFEAHPDSARMSYEDGTSAEAVDFRYVHGSATPGAFDTAILDGSATGQDWFVGTPEDGRLSGQRDDGSGFFIRGRGFQRVTVDSRGGSDVAQLYDSPGEDELTADPETATLSGPGFELTVNLFDYVHTYASDDGQDDMAFLDTSATGQDWFYGTPQDGRLSGQRDDGTDFLLRAVRFDSVTATSRGGSDVAQLYDSPGEDELTADPETATLSGPGFELNVNLFDYVHTYASDDGQTDTATLTGSATGQDWFIATPEYGRLAGQRDDGTNFFHRAVRFDQLIANSGGGDDVAQLYDSLGDDVLKAYPDAATMTREDGTSAQALGFRYLHGYASPGGFDTATLYDTTTDGLTSYTTKFTSEVRPNGRHLRRMTCNYGTYLSATDFNYTRAVSKPGQDDVAVLHDSALSDTYEAYIDRATMTYEDGTVVRADNYRYTHGDSRNGGFDTATLYDTTADGQTSYTTEFTAKVLPNGRHRRWSTCDYGTYLGAMDFDYTRAVSTPGQSDVAQLHDSALSDEYQAYFDHVMMTYEDGTVVQAENYRYTHAYSRNGGFDTATLFDQTIGGTSYVTEFHGDATSSRLFTAGNGFFTRTVEFEKVRAALSDSDDRAYLFDDPALVDHLVVPFDGDFYNAPAKAKFFNSNRTIFIDGFLWLQAYTSQDFEDDKQIAPAYAAEVILLGNWADP